VNAVVGRQLNAINSGTNVMMDCSSAPRRDCPGERLIDGELAKCPLTAMCRTLLSLVAAIKASVVVTDVSEMVIVVSSGASPPSGNDED
jgi:hypothetical protein